MQVIFKILCILTKLLKMNAWIELSRRLNSTCSLKRFDQVISTFICGTLISHGTKTTYCTASPIWQNTCSKSVWIWKKTTSKWLTMTSNTFCYWEFRDVEFYVKYMNVHLWVEISQWTIWEETGFHFIYLFVTSIILGTENENGNFQLSLMPINYICHMPHPGSRYKKSQQ